MLLDACTVFCATLSETFGATLVELVAIILGFVVVAWRGKKQMQKLEDRTATSHAKVADQVAETKQQLARIEGSLRPSSPSGTHEPVRLIDSRPSLPEDTLLGSSPLPGVPTIPSGARPTPPERPSTKREER